MKRVPTYLVPLGLLTAAVFAVANSNGPPTTETVSTMPEVIDAQHATTDEVGSDEAIPPNAEHAEAVADNHALPESGAWNIENDCDEGEFTDEAWNDDDLNGNNTTTATTGIQSDDRFAYCFAIPDSGLETRHARASPTADWTGNIATTSADDGTTWTTSEVAASAPGARTTAGNAIARAIAREIAPPIATTSDTEI